MNKAQLTGEADLPWKPILIVEHCEPEITPWLILEYRHVSLIYGRSYVWYTNVPSRYHRLLSKYGLVKSKSVIDLVRTGAIDPSVVIVLDPKASRSLTYEDLASAGYVVVGGILGDHPPRGRTWEYITSRMPACVRSFNIGDGQYSIDGAVFYVNYVLKHKGTEGFTYVDGVTVQAEHGEVYLPFRYPIVNGKPLLADGLEYYLKYRRIRDDIWRELTE